MSITIKRYTSVDSQKWDDFVQSSNNGTLFHYRSFLTYHIDRKFEDHSLIFLKKGKIIVLLSAAEVMDGEKKILYSHPGATFGGLVYSQSLSFKDSMNIGELLKNYANENEFNIIRITMPPIIYSAVPSDYFEFSLLKIGAYPEKSEMSSVVNLNLPKNEIEANVKSSHRQAERKAERHGIIVKESNDYETFHSILAQNLELRHEVRPTHSLDELQKLVKLFPEKITLHTAHYNDNMLAGIVNFVCNNNTVLAFYICHDHQFQDHRSLNLLFLHVFDWAINGGYKFYDFGIFTVNEEPNYGLARFKENFGANGYFRKTLRIDI
ncbi:MAG: GNAT family N-acetyltransferase [Candidatus Marinimicrobia bacterium]|nr:GNAT family N-acetyltransferase [Candidatus Neomarinimicrobiota bacterium]